MLERRLAKHLLNPSNNLDWKLQMTTDESRDSKVLIKEAELLYASNDFIYKFYKETEKYSSQIDEIIESKLLSRNDPFLDITLAQYCQHNNTIFNLFSKAIQSDNLPLKLACLSNEFNAFSESIPSVLFRENRWDDCPLLLNWFKSISFSEIEVLFSNKSIDRYWLGSLLKCDDKFWIVLKEDQQLHILRSLCKNSVIKDRDIGFFIDGLSEYEHNRLFYSIWSLAEKLPTTRQYAYALSILLEKTAFIRSHFDTVQVAKRWDILDDTESKTDAKLVLNSYELVRFYLYKNVVKDLYGDDCSNKEHFDNADTAYRCCAYRQLKNITVDDMNSIVEKDGALAVNYLLMNDNLWISEETREALQDLCYKADSKQPDGISFCTNDFLVREKKMEELNPNWFIEKIFDDSNIDDKPLNLGMAREIIRESKEDFANGLLILLDSIKSELRILKWIFYIVLASFLAILLK
jgi:hypothetical protein